jgi:hypothetical protein
MIKLFESVKLEPDGIPPIPRVYHATTVILDKYLVIHGGKSAKAYSAVNNLALNDICMYNIMFNKWEKLAINGFHPSSRWGHSIAAYKHNKIILFGGLNMSQYCENSLSVLTFTNLDCQEDNTPHTPRTPNSKNKLKIKQKEKKKEEDFGETILEHLYDKTALGSYHYYLTK